MRRVRRIRMTLMFLASVLWAAVRQRTVPVKPFGSYRGPLSIALTPQGEFLPAMSGGAPDPPDPDPAPDPTPDPEPEPDPEPTPDPDPTPEPEPEPFDRERAERTIKQQRAAEKREKEARQKAERERDELRQAQESEQERITRERDEAKAAAERAESARRHTLIDLAIRDAAADAEVPAKKVRRLLRLIDRDAITVDEGDEVSGAEDAVAEFLDEFPEFKPTEATPEPDPTPEPPGGRPDRSRQPKELTPEAVAKMAKTEPERFNQLFDEGKIPESALKGLKK